MERVRRIRESWASFQERFERTAVGQLLISVLVGSIILTAVVCCLPDSAIRQDLLPVARPIANSTGLDQNWGVFAPDPIRRLEEVEVRITTVDDTILTWKIPPPAGFVGQFSWYHWQKLKEKVIRVPGIRAGLCHWVIRNVVEPPEQPARVEMILNTVALLPPGSNAVPKRGQFVLYDEKLAR
ncbi:hypothetical protein [Antrihabitans cavernicola]|uniref:Uncharacterized protein n=1 Tax=Antrihabitans cavernicola TaxID=2495913 RepID=A0A5A7S925_9NOCA|nr:hypothetical protein [Spelaeibacter cavernicola]KAA0019428.1 hypothetical protein FOY51_22550 [Spelaeibacter cavernicola]